MKAWEIYTVISDGIQVFGNVFILLGYWLMARTVKWASASLIVGCITYALWSMFIDPPAYPLLGLELTCAAMSARALWLNRRA